MSERGEKIAVCKSLSEGGQRCAHHTRAKLQKKAEALQAAATHGDPNHFAKCREEWEAAAVEYASTPGGHTVLSSQRDTAKQAHDSHTEAMLTSILSRGDAMRAANEDIRASLALASFTATSLPEAPLEPVVSIEMAPDETGHPLTGEDVQVWTDAMQAAMRTTDTSAEGMNWVREKAAVLKRLDDTLASATATDREICRASQAVGSYFTGHHPEVYKALDMQNRRALNHPGAGAETYKHLADTLDTDMVLAHPKVPGEVVADVMAWSKNDELSDETWKVLGNRARAGDVDVALSVASTHPDEYVREDAVGTLAGADYATMNPATFRRLMAQVPKLHASTDVKKFMLDSMETHLKFYPDVERSATAMATLRQSKEAVAMQQQGAKPEQSDSDEPRRWGWGNKSRTEHTAPAAKAAPSLARGGNEFWPQGPTLD